MGSQHGRSARTGRRACRAARDDLTVEARIVDVTVRDIRFPTSRTLDGSDAVNVDPDYSATYVVLHTDADLEGHGLTFTIGRGNELCVAAVHALAHHLRGRTLSGIVDDMQGFWRSIVGDTQIRWVGPEKGVVHLAAAALVNATWDLWAKSAGKPLWKLVADLSPEQLVSCAEFRYIADALNPDEALELVRRVQSTVAEREAEMAVEASRRTRPRPDGSATPTTSCGGFAVRRSRKGGRTSSSRSAATSTTTCAGSRSSARRSGRRGRSCSTRTRSGRWTRRSGR